MQNDLREFLSCLAGAVAMSMVPVLLTAFFSMPATFHHHQAGHPMDLNVPAEHMT